ncbi:hypothetical protein GJAV_G00008130 [Gymnothorax javanicus]|nr:hypothetical protein GJAV_G00008130 [Gymnothorax javanicus]
MTARSRRRKELGTHSNDKDCDWSEKDCSCPCHDAAHDVKLRRHKRKGCCHCHTNKVSDSSRGVKRRDAASSLQPESQTERRVGEREEEKEGEKETETEVEMEVKDEGGSEANSPPPAEQGPQQCDSSEGGPAPSSEERGGEVEEEEEEWKGTEREGCPPSAKRSRKEGEGVVVCNRPLAPSSGERETLTSSQPPRHTPCADPPVCAKNISLTPSGEKVILWTREADRVILTACQQQGANQSTFQAISAQLGNKTASEVSQRFRDLMHLFHTAARQASSEDEASNTEQLSATDEEPD